jgi:hypothetical protein
VQTREPRLSSAADMAGLMNYEEFKDVLVRLALLVFSDLPVDLSTAPAPADAPAVAVPAAGKVGVADKPPAPPAIVSGPAARVLALMSIMHATALNPALDQLMWQFKGVAHSAVAHLSTNLKLERPVKKAISPERHRLRYATPEPAAPLPILHVKAVPLPSDRDPYIGAEAVTDMTVAPELMAILAAPPHQAMLRKIYQLFAAKGFLATRPSTFDEFAREVENMDAGECCTTLKELQVCPQWVPREAVFAVFKSRTRHQVAHLYANRSADDTNHLMNYQEFKDVLIRLALLAFTDSDAPLPPTATQVTITAANTSVNLSGVRLFRCHFVMAPARA